jgi:hypothetical protein
MVAWAPRRPRDPLAEPRSRAPLRNHGLPGCDQLADGDEAIALLLQLGQGEGKGCGGIASAAVGMADDDRPPDGLG